MSPFVECLKLCFLQCHSTSRIVLYGGDVQSLGPERRSFLRKIMFRLLIGLMCLYFACGGYVWWAMHQPPETFARAMARMPGPVVFLLFPFETFWTEARAGSLRVGDPAPDFSLPKLDKSQTVQLSRLSRQQPVVLVFGSYT